MSQEVSPHLSSASGSAENDVIYWFSRHRVKRLPGINSPLEKTCESWSQIARSRQLVDVASSESPPVARTEAWTTFLSTPKLKEV
jgi:hypothetical protein